MTIELEIEVNKYGQGLIDQSLIVQIFETFNLEAKREFLRELIFLIIQSKVTDADIDLAIQLSGLKSTITPCIMIRKGTASYNLLKIIELPEMELSKVLKLFLSLFKIGYVRRQPLEKTDPNKWWYWDLSNEDVVRLVKERYVVPPPSKN